MSQPPDFRHIRTHSVRGKNFHVVWKRPPGRPPKSTGKDYWAGQCESPRDKGRELWLTPEQDGLDMVGTVVHEVAHGAFWDLSEEAIEEYEASVIRLLRRMGARVTFEPRMREQ